MAKQAVLRIKLAGASYPVTIDPFIQQAELVAPAGVAGDYFGYAVSLSSDGATALIGAPERKVGSNNHEGAAYVFTKNGNSWSQQAQLIASNGSTNNLFGWSVALSSDGNTALVGAAYKTLGANPQQGAVYVYSRNDQSWSQQQILTASDGAASDSFGYAVAVSSDGSTALIGAAFKTVGANSNQGAVYAFTQSGGIWSQQAELTAADGATDDTFGRSLSLSGDGSTALIGAYNKTVGANSVQGAAYVFIQSGVVWLQQSELTASDGTANDNFGNSVALSTDGNTALIGAPAKNIGSNINQGAAYAYTRSGVTWSQQQILTASDGASTDYYGQSVALSSDGSSALVSAFTKSIDPNFLQGAVYQLTRNGNSWSEQQWFTASDGSANDDFGFAVSLSSDGNSALIGAYDKNNQQGAAYTFALEQPSTITLTSSPNPSTFGQAVTFTATVSPITATGTVGFTFDNGTTITTTLSSGNATYITTTLPIGSHVVTATYSGNVTYTGSVSQPITQVVQPVCNPLVVTIVTDDGSGTSCGTLSYALYPSRLRAPPRSRSLLPSPRVTPFTFTGSLTTTAKVKLGVHALRWRVWQYQPHYSQW